jgi:TolA-binding protein
MENYSQAETFFRNVIQGDWDQLTKHHARVGLARVALQQNNFGEASSVLNTVLNNGEPEVAAEAQYLLGETYRLQGDCDQAVVEYLKTKYLYGSEEEWVVQSVYNAAECNVRLNQLDNARRLYRSIISDFPSDSTYAPMAQQRLEDLMGEG